MFTRPGRPVRSPLLAVGLALLAFVASASGCAGASDDGADGSSDALSADGAPLAWSSAATLKDRYHSEIEPYFADHAKRGSFVGVDGVPIEYAEMVAPNEKAAIVVFSGRTESMVKYTEVAFDLHRRGYSLYFFDHRGQGLSGRMLPDHDKGYVKHFSDYVTDAETFIDTVVAPKHHARLFALGHSMGGAILANYLLQRPSTFRAAAFTSPMFEIKFPAWVNEFTASLISHFGDDTDYAIGEGPYKPGRQNIYQHSPERFAIYYDSLVDEFPQIALGGPTKSWLIQAVDGGQNVRDNAASLAMPMLLFQGSDDQIVDNRGENTACSRAKACKLVVMSGGGHELLVEKDDLRSSVLDQLTAFVDAH